MREQLSMESRYVEGSVAKDATVRTVGVEYLGLGMTIVLRSRGGCSPRHLSGQTFQQFSSVLLLLPAQSSPNSSVRFPSNVA